MGRQKAAEKLEKHLDTRIERERLEQRGILKAPPLSRKEQLAEQDRKERATKALERTLQRQIDSETGLPRVNPWAQVEASATGEDGEEEAHEEDLNAPIRREGLRELAAEVSPTVSRHCKGQLTLYCMGPAHGIGAVGADPCAMHGRFLLGSI